MDAIVTSIHDRGPLAGLRGLGQAGVRVLAVSSGALAPGHLSRYAAGRATAPDSIADPEGFARRIVELAREHGPLVVYPGREEGIDALLGRADGAALLPYPNLDALPLLRDKRKLAELAVEAGLTTPRLIAAGTAAELRAADLELPCVIKAAIPGGPPELARTASGRDHLAAVLDDLPPDAELLVQTPGEGPLNAVVVVLTPDGKLAARFQQVTERTWPFEAGVSAYARSVAPEPDRIDAAVRLLRTAGYAGLAELQFLGSTLIDVNPRYYGSMPLALRAGVNLPAIWHRVVTGEAPDPPDYRTGVAFRWLEADMLAFLRGHRELLRARARGVSVAGAWWDPRDPGASLAMTIRSGALRVRRRLRRH